MKLGNYEFTKIHADTAVPHRSGFLLIVDRQTGEINVCSASDLYLRHRAGLKGDVGAVFKSRYPTDPASHLDFYYRVVLDTHRTIFKWRLQNLAGKRLQSRPVKYSVPKEQRLTLVRHKPTGHYRISIKNADTRPQTLSAIVTELNRIRLYRHPTNNQPLRDFVQQYGPFELSEDEFDIQDMGTFPNREVALSRARELAKELGKSKLLTVRIL